LVALLAQALGDAEVAGAVTLGSLQARPADVASVIVAAIDGIKHAEGAGPKFAEDIQLFMRLLRAAIS
jgi:hypothetical protein